ncbi:protein FAM3B-like isoform X1 [Carcharodon carcharias]|uniref:protein FAM3B-like isoform X1 n=2 Tax=Carcharodon carcharias TaxID=13397 RepID=UPI001B7DFD01|nr:protein FAM3B-like isoform X1 [Carcharodon carcharias]
MANQLRLRTDGLIKLVMVVVGCIAAWCLGLWLADYMIDGSLSQTFSRVQKLVQKPTHKASSQKQHKCDHQKSCPIGTFAFLVLSGAEKSKPPKICFEDEILLGDVKNNFGQGMNIAIVEAKTGKLVDTGNFDLWGGDNSEPMIDFVKKAPDGSLILMATFGESSTRLTEEAKKYIEALGSVEVQKLAYRGNWVFLGTKGFGLPKSFRREKIINSESWPAEIQIDGCFSPKTDYL